MLSLPTLTHAALVAAVLIAGLTAHARQPILIPEAHASPRSPLDDEEQAASRRHHEADTIDAGSAQEPSSTSVERGVDDDTELISPAALYAGLTAAGVTALIGTVGVGVTVLAAFLQVAPLLMAFGAAPALAAPVAGLIAVLALDGRSLERRFLGALAAGGVSYGAAMLLASPATIGGSILGMVVGVGVYLAFPEPFGTGYASIGALMAGGILGFAAGMVAAYSVASGLGAGAAVSMFHEEGE